MADNSIEALQFVRQRLVAQRRLTSNKLAGRGADSPLEPKHAIDLVSIQEAIEVVDRAIDDERRIGAAPYSLDNVG